MAARIVVCCDGSWGPPPMPCRANVPTKAATVAVARTLAESYGWRCDDGGDLCPACARFAPVKVAS